MSKTEEEIARDWDNAKKVGGRIDNEIKRAYKGACSKSQNEGLKLLQLLKSAMRKPLQLRKTKELIATCKLKVQDAINDRFQIAMEILPEILEDENLTDLKKLALQKITSNAKELFGSRHFQELPLEALREIFKEDLAATEAEILTATRNWAQFQIHHRIQGFPGGDENVKIPLEDVTKEICAAIKDIIPKKSLDEFITMLNNIQGAECEVIQEQEVEDSAEVVLKEEIHIDDKNFLDFSAVDNNATIGDGDEQGGEENSAKDKITEIENRDLSNPTSIMELVKSESAVDVLDKNGEEINSPEVLDLDRQVGHNVVAGVVAVDAGDSVNPGARNEENAQNNGNEEGQLEQSRIVYEAKAGIDNPQMTSSDETPPQPHNPEADSSMELEDRNDDRATSTAAEGSVDGGVDPGSKDEGTIPQQVQIEDKKFYIDDIKVDEDSDSSEEDNNLSICDTESAKIKKRSKVAIPEIPILNAASRLGVMAVNKWKIDANDKQRSPKESTTATQSSTLGLKSVFVSLKRLSVAQILSMGNKMAVKSKPELKCPHCPKILSCKAKLTEHIRSHTGERPFPCPHCPYASSRAEDLRKHIQRMHSQENQNLFSCRICTEKFPSRRILSAHMKNHLKCYFCSHIFPDFGAMSRHLVTHTGEKPFNCPHCPHSTSQERRLKLHIRRRHLNVKQSLNPSHNNKNNSLRSLRIRGQLHCYFCSYKTKDNSKLVVHVRNHTGEKPFSCPRCSYAAKDSVDI